MNRRIRIGSVVDHIVVSRHSLLLVQCIKECAFPRFNVKKAGTSAVSSADTQNPGFGDGQAIRFIGLSAHIGVSCVINARLQVRELNFSAAAEHAAGGPAFVFFS
jgi:hypothetical protein